MPRESDYFIPAQYFLGVAETREYHGPEAVEAFKNVLRKNIELRAMQGKKKNREGRKITRRSDKKKRRLGYLDRGAQTSTIRTQRFEELANIALGYIFYQVGKFDTSLKYFNKISIQSPYWLDSCSPRRGRSSGSSRSSPTRPTCHYQRTLGYIHTLNAPFFFDYLYPESLILKAVTYYFNCRYAAAKASIEEFSRRYSQTKQDLNDLLDQAPEDFRCSSCRVKIRDSDVGARALRRDGRPQVAAGQDAREVLRLRQPARVRAGHPVQGDELGLPGQRARHAVAREPRPVALARQGATGAQARQRINAQIAEIKNLEKEAIKVEYEIVEKLKKLGEDVQGAEDKIKPGPEEERYNYNGEYWQDELGYYYYKVTSVCAE